MKISNTDGAKRSSLDTLTIEVVLLSSHLLPDSIYALNRVHLLPEVPHFINDFWQEMSLIQSIPE